MARRGLPRLFAYPRQIDRVRVYSIAYDVRDLLAFPPTVRAPPPAPSCTPTTASAAWWSASSYLDVLGRGRL